MEMKPLAAIFLLLLPCCCPRPWTAAEVGVAAGSTITAAADAYTTKRVCVDGGYDEYTPYLRANPPLLIGVSHILCLGLAHYVPEITVWGMRFEVRNTLLIGKGALNAGWAVHNKRLM